MKDKSERYTRRSDRQARPENAREAFLSCFSPRHRYEVVEFGKRLRCVEADYFLFMARKAVCFYECLAALKLTELRGVLISDRVLDMDLAWLRGKKVALVDDAVIYGTSLAKISARLREAGAIVSDVVVFCVNVTSWQSERIAPSEPFLRMDEKETTGFCADLVRAISVLPIPYAVDYPIIRRLRIIDADMAPLLCLPGWEAKAHTTPLQHSRDVSTIVCTPTSARRLDIFPERESALSGVCHLAKVRLYGRHIDKHGATWFSIMPVVVLDPLAIDHVDDLWRSVLASTTPKEAASLKECFASATSMLRGVQFIIAARVARIWLRDTRTLLGLNVAPRLDSSFAGFSFTPAMARSICHIAVRGVDFSASRAIKSADAAMVRIERPLDTYEHNPWSMQAALIKPFLDLHLQKEVPARQQRLTIDELPDAVQNRLNEGFSLKQLRQCVAGVTGKPSKMSVLSEFLDHAIDRGFIVPITAVSNNVVFRAYRYGEDIRDAEQFRQLCARCAQSFLDANGATGISRTWLEKLLVLLFRSMLSQRLIDPTDLAMGSSGTIGIRYALHGAVLKESSPRLYSHYDGDFYFDVLNKYGFFQSAESGQTQPELQNFEGDRPVDRVRRYLPVLSRDPIPESTEAVELAESLGLLIGSLAAKTDRSFTSDDLTLLATCYSPDSTAAALAAELDIMCKNWRFTDRQLRSGGEGANLAALRKTIWFTALNSARFKYQNYILDATDTRLDLIDVELSARPDRESKFIQSSLKAFRRIRLPRNSYSRSDPRYLLLLEMGRLLYELNLLVRLLMLGVGSDNDAAVSQNVVRELSELTEEHAKLLARATENPQPEHFLPKLMLTATKRAMQPDVDLAALRNWAKSILNEKVTHAGEYLERVDHVVARVGLPNQFELFPHVLVIEPNMATRSRSFDRALDKVLIQAGREFNSRQDGGRAYSHTFFKDANGAGLVAVGFRGDAARGLLDAVVDLLLLTRGNIAIRRLLGLLDIERAEQPLKSECSPRCIAQLFWQRVQVCMEHPRLNASGCYRLSPFEDQIQFDPTPVLNRASTEPPLHVSLPTERSYLMEHKAFQSNSGEKQGLLKTSMGNRADIGIICVTPSELRALLSAMKSLPDFVEEKKSEYFSASLPGDDCNHRVVMTFCVDPGNVSAALTAGKFLAKFKPRLLVMLGMAGSISDDAQLLDVGISTQVIYYEKGKERDSGVSSRLESMPVSAFLRRNVTAFLASQGAPQARIEYDDEGSTHGFGILEGPIGTGEAIVGSTNSAARKIVLQCNDKAILVETEAWGVHRAVYEENAKRQSCKHVLTIKGVADRADSVKDDLRQYRATRNAFETLRALLKRIDKKDLG